MGSGDQIEIEERHAGEMIERSGAPKDMPCWNPAFDVTPAEILLVLSLQRRGCGRSWLMRLKCTGWFNPMGHDVRSCFP